MPLFFSFKSGVGGELLRVKLHNFLKNFKVSRLLVAEKDKLIPHVVSRQNLPVFPGRHL